MRRLTPAVSGINRRSFLVGGVAAALLASGRGVVVAEEVKLLELPAPQTEGGRPLMLAIKARRTSRSFKSESLPPQVLSNLLWAGFGVNRPETGGRTAPSASNSQEMDIYVSTSDGLYLYDAKRHALKPIAATDLRSLTGRQAFVKDAPVTLIFVADMAKLKAAPADQDLYIGAHTGFISQNIYLACASEGLATCVRANLDRLSLAKAMGLRADQRITLAQTVGHPK